MIRNAITRLTAVLAGLLVGLLFWGLMLGAQVRRHEPGLWTVRFQRVLRCGVDYNGPPFREQGMAIWLTCGGEDRGWQIWPP